MSTSANEKSTEKQDQLKYIIKELHRGVPVARLQKKFRNLIAGTSAEEIADMENALINEGFPPEEIQRLCDVHAQVFEKSLSKVGKPGKIPGHPLFSFIQENKEARKILKRLSRQVKKMKKASAWDEELEKFEREFKRLKEIEKHYLRKENQLFPALEAKDFLGPSKVMWGKHNEIREDFKKTNISLLEKNSDDFYKSLKSLTNRIKKMIFLEEKILFPTSARKLSTAEWARIKQGEKEIGYAWITPSNLWDAQLAGKISEESELSAAGIEQQEDSRGAIDLSEGRLTEEQLNLLLTHLPLDITFVDETDRVCFYSAGKERIFPRSPAVIGREVQNCHPHKSVHVVNKIVESFRKKEKDVAEFWIQKDSAFIHIRYFPVYDKEGNYRGVIEVSQEISGIRKLEGERRILDWE